MIVYLARNRTNGKAYVGKTKRSLEQRTKEHLQAARSGSDMLFSRALRKHGPASFEWMVLVELEQGEATEAQADACLNMYERRMIALYEAHGPKGYNLTDGGDGVSGWSPTAEHRQKIREAHLGEKNHNFGKDWGRKGPWSEETKQKMSEAATGRTHSSETKAKITEALRQRVRKTRSVIQYGMDGSQIAVHASAKIAAEMVNCHKDRIGDCCRGSRESHAGFGWRYAEEQKGSR